jgi:hypothetical protein
MDRRAVLLGVGVAFAALVVAIALAAGGSSDAEDAQPNQPIETPSPTILAETLGPPTPSGPPLLLPNMRSLDASDLQIEQRGSLRRLRFAASLANLGPGPLLLDPRGQGGCPRGQIAADQLLHQDGNDDGEFQRRLDKVADRRLAGCMLDHPDHDHWHFRAMASYVLRDPAGGVIGSREKVSFCLRDNTLVPGAPVVVRREYFGECSRTKVQGISPGWVDVYSAELTGQGIRLPDELTGRFCLELTADPLGRVVETDETDNARTIGIQILPDDVRRLAVAGCSS